MSIQQKHGRSFALLGFIWLLSAISDRIWFALDHSVPAWDQADYLTGSLNYWEALQHPQWFSGEWWRDLWIISPKVPPLTYLLTSPFQTLFGTGPDQATLVNLLFSAILFSSIYGLGTQLFSRRIGLWAAALCLLLPGLYVYRLQYLLDYPTTAMVALSFFCLTVWRHKTQNQPSSSRSQWLWAIAFGFSFGFALFVKQTALFFLFTPIVWMGITTLKQRRWKQCTQLLTALLLSGLILMPWVRTNWLLMLTSGKRATIDSALAEGDPALNTLKAWTYYWNLLPYHVSWPLLLVPLVGFLLYLIKFKSFTPRIRQYLPAWRWLAVFLIGGYLLCSLNINKDFRYSFPLLPILAIVLAYGLTLWPQPWGKTVRGVTVSLAVVLMLLNLWPIGGVWGRRMAAWLSPGGDRIAHLGQKWPHEEVIANIIQTQPYLEATLGVLPSTPDVNQHNLNYYGALQQDQVSGRQVGTRLDHVPQDALTLSWFVTKTGTQGSVKRINQAQAAIVREIEQGRQFELHDRWMLPDNTVLNLYHRKQPYIEVYPQSQPFSEVELSQVIAPQTTPPGVPIPVIYAWYGSWEQLQSGLVLLRWKLESDNQQPEDTSFSFWLHDHAIGMGMLHPDSLNPDQLETGFQVIERMGMFPPKNVPRGTYKLEAVYLNRETGQTYPMTTPPVSITIDPQAQALPAPELDLVTQLRRLALDLPKGIEGLERIFDEIARINQYDPSQDYTVQAEKTLAYRLQIEPQNLDWAYALALSAVLQQNAPNAISALEQVIKLDAQNPFAYAYLAFVHLYNLNPQAAEVAIESALQLNPNQPEFQAIRGIAALMQAKVIPAWQDLNGLEF